ncbi:MAG: DnaJ domain-containing protein [Candidatus Omnitrophica bacterium]|nr:DnaJ domain-containing protein [Candidatus Omnitrophota bacterium]
MADFGKIDQARRTLGLDDEATLREIKDAYRRLALEHHPDKCPESKKRECEEKFKTINDSYEVLMAYCAGYRFSFREDEAREAGMDEKLSERMKTFYEDWWRPEKK